MTVEAKRSRYYTYIEPVIKNPNVRSFAPFIFNLLALTIFILFAIRPTISTILNLHKDIDNNTTVLQALNTKTQNLTTGRSNLEAISLDDRKRINNSVPLQPSVSALIAIIQNSTAGQGSLSALQIQPISIYESKAADTLPSKLTEIEFTYTLQGSYTQLVTSLNNADKASRLLSIDNVLISRQGTSSATMAVSGKAYFLK